MELIYIQLDAGAIADRFDRFDRLGNLNSHAQEEAVGERSEHTAESLPFNPEIPLPYILRPGAPLGDSESPDATEQLDWNGIVDGILYLALYEPRHEQLGYYKDFLLALEPELPYVLQDRLRDQYDERLWLNARDTVRILLFLLPEASWPLLELGYLHEQEAEQALMEQRFAACCESWDLGALAYGRLLERDERDARSSFQLGYYYLQCWNYPAAYQAFVSSQQLALSPEHPLWSKCEHWLQKLSVFESLEQRSEQEQKALSLSWERLLADFRRALRGADEAATDFAAGPVSHCRSLWLRPLDELDGLLREQPESGFLWYLRGLCLLYGHDMSILRDLADPAEAGTSGNGASAALGRAEQLSWETPLDWQLPYYLGLSHYLEASYRKAERYFSKVLKKNTEHAATLYWLEKLYAELEDPRSSQYQVLLRELYPDFPDLIQAFF